MTRFGLSKKEIISNKKNIATLFEEGKSYLYYPFRYIFKLDDSQHNILQVLFTVPKKKVPLAVNRNRIKRQMKEAYRLNKHLLLSSLVEKKVKASIILVYSEGHDFEFNQIQDKISVTLNRLVQEV